MDETSWLHSRSWVSGLARALIVGAAWIAQVWEHSVPIRQAASTAIILVAICVSTSVGSAASGVTIDDLVGRTTISSWSVSPDGSYVAFLTSKGLPRLNVYEM